MNLRITIFSKQKIFSYGYSFAGFVSGIILFLTLFGDWSITKGRFLLREITWLSDVILPLVYLGILIMILFSVRKLPNNRINLLFRLFLIGYIVTPIGLVLNLLFFDPWSSMFVEYHGGIIGFYFAVLEDSDARIIRNLEQGQGIIGEYYLSKINDSYEGFCEYDETPMALGYRENLNWAYFAYGSEPVCYDSEVGWAAEAKLIKNGMSWCVDSAGYSDMVPDGTLSTGDVVCRK